VKLWRKPLDLDRVVVPRGEIHLIVERCKGCQLCVTYCPRGVLEMSSLFNAKGYHPPQVSDSQHCVACGLCEMLCPEFAIYVLEVLHEQ
jgi:2-oxoglutarate ferredoxin oxidoreductase subunit delta